MADKPSDPTTPFGDSLSRPRPDLKNDHPQSALIDTGKRRFRDAFLLQTDRIQVNADQVRQEGKGTDDRETLALAVSIQEQGLQHLIVVRHHKQDDVYEIVSGERRFIAMTEILNWTEIPVRLLGVPEAEVMWLQLHENLLRKSLSPNDLATAIHKAKSEGLSLQQIAEKLTDEALQELQQDPQAKSRSTNDRP